MSRRSVALVLAACLLCSTRAYSYESDRAINNFAHEFVECAVYYTISVDGMRRVNRIDLVKSSQAAADRAFSIALLFSEPATVAARQDFALKDQAALMKNDFANFSVLMAKYGEPCRAAVENPRARLLYWLSKAP